MDLKLRRVDIAGCIGVPLKNYYRIESGHRHLHVSELIKLHHEYGVTPNEILLGPHMRDHFARLQSINQLTPMTRTIVTRYLRLPQEFRMLVNRVIDALTRACIDRGEIEPIDD